jgi:sugar phosphate isomerase/epimerase
METQHSRRDFLRISASGAVGALVLPSLSSSGFLAGTSPQKADNIGLQLYTIRDNMKKDPRGSLKKVSDIGYKYIELADYNNRKFYGFTPDEFKKVVSDLGLKVLSSHINVESAGNKMDNAQMIAEDHLKIGAQYCIQPWIEAKDRNIAFYQKMVADWNEAGRIMKKNGLKFGYHNHNFEFAKVDGKIPYFDIFLAGLDKDLVIMELDLFWATKAGQDPVEIFKKYPGRFELFHVKDMFHKQAPIFDPGEASDFAPVGNGVIDFKRILADSKTAGMKYMIVEQDNAEKDKPFEAIQASLNNLKTKILA